MAPFVGSAIVSNITLEVQCDVQEMNITDQDGTVARVGWQMKMNMASSCRLSSDVEGIDEALKGIGG